MFYRDWITQSPLRISDSYGDNHWRSFEDIRRKNNENIFEETNKFILRLDKIIETGGSTEVVEWTPNDIVKLCPYCAKAFNIARRRHHCRLCGAIMCNTCSHFLEYTSACKLVKPAKIYTNPYDRIEENLQARNDEEKPKIRVCEDCKRLLDRRLQSIEDYYYQPTFLDLYKELRKTMAEADELILSELSLSNQPSSPKETILELRTKIHDLRQSIAVISSKFERLSEKEARCKQAHLLASINQSIMHWLSETVENKESRLYGRVAHQSQSGRSTGWVPEQPSLDSTATSDGSDENPLLIQIRRLDEYIKQAKLADRYEEASALEANKRELSIEYYFIQQGLNSMTMNDTSDGHECDPQHVARDDVSDMSASTSNVNKQY